MRLLLGKFAIIGLFSGVISQCPRENSDIVICIGQGYKDVPKHFKRSITVLTLSENSITALTYNTLKMYQHVREFRLEYNLVKSTRDITAISEMKNLRVFDISGNDLYTFDFQVFAQNTKLEKVLSDNNPRIYIKEKPTNLKHLRHISLRNNNLDHFPLQAFIGFSGLQILDLRGNRLKSLPKEMSNALPRLSRFLISNNQLTILDAHLMSVSDLSRKMSDSAELRSSTKRTQESDLMRYISSKSTGNNKKSRGRISDVNTDADLYINRNNLNSKDDNMAPSATDDMLLQVIYAVSILDVILCIIPVTLGLILCYSKCRVKKPKSESV